MNNRYVSLSVLASVIVSFIYYKTMIGKQTAPYESHEYIVLNDFISSSEEQALRRHFEQIDSFPRAKVDFSSKLHVDIGEAYEPNEKGQCLKPKTMLHAGHNTCVFIPRMDTIPHYGITGGYEGFKEGKTKLQARVSLFIKHDFSAYNRIYKPLFEAKPHTNAIRNICPSHRPYIKPIEISLTLQLPGQGLLSHHDAVYFAGATRFTHPLWLLEVMKVSHLFDAILIPQIQGVLYVGENNKEGGELYTYPNGTEHDVVLIPPTSRSVVIMDGTEIVHGTVVYSPSIEPLLLTDDSYIKFDRDKHLWVVYMDDVATEYEYNWGDIRASIAYRALCFEDEDTMRTWDQYESKLTIDEILETFRNDLVSKNVTTHEKWNAMSRYDIGVMLVDMYMKLPSSELAFFPWNYHLLVEYYCNRPNVYNSIPHRVVQAIVCIGYER